jgi:tRNA nucleotidyltransferase/poly(A) polymerase
MKWTLPDEARSRKQVSTALEIAKRLKDTGYQTYLVGGAVRDSLIGIPTLDVDLCTACPATKLVDIIPNAEPFGLRRYSIFRVPTEIGYIEIARFREESEFDGRHCVVRLTDSFENDVRRRDFTINAIAVDPMTMDIIDLVGGIADISARIIRSIGDPSRRYIEDRLRMLRAIRFAAKLEFSISKADIDNIIHEAMAIKSLSAARLRDEIGAILTGQHPGRGIRLLADCELWQHIFMEFAEYPISPGWERKLASLERAARNHISEDGMWALAFMPGNCHALQDVSVIADAIERFKFPKKQAKRIFNLCKGINDSHKFVSLPDGRAVELADSPDIAIIRELVRICYPESDFETALARRFSSFGQEPFLKGSSLGKVLTTSLSGQEIGDALIALRVEELSGRVRSIDGAKAFLRSFKN